MPLTPSEVAATQFRVAFRGYAIDEVDAFLDEVEAELARLLTAAAARPAGAVETSTDRPDAVAARPAPTGTTVLPAAGTAELEGQETALRTLLLAQRTADQAVAEAREEAAQLVAAARQEADATLAAAREEADATLSAAREQAEATAARSAEQAAAAERELTERRSQALDELERRRAQLAAGVEELQAFEREYRTRLRAYLQGQLRDLDGSGGSDDGVPVGARGAAVGRSSGGAVRIGGPSPVAPAAPLRAVPAADDPAGPAPTATTAEH